MCTFLPPWPRPVRAALANINPVDANYTVRQKMHLERKDYRGILVFFSVVAFCAAYGLADRTIDRTSGEQVGRSELVVGHTGDQKFWSYAGFAASIGAVLATLAMIRPLWEQSPKRKEPNQPPEPTR